MFNFQQLKQEHILLANEIVILSLLLEKDLRHLFWLCTQMFLAASNFEFCLCINYLIKRQSKVSNKSFFISVNKQTLFLLSILFVLKSSNENKSIFYQLWSFVIFNLVTFLFLAVNTFTPLLFLFTFFHTINTFLNCWIRYCHWLLFLMTVCKAL